MANFPLDAAASLQDVGAREKIRRMSPGCQIGLFQNFYVVELTINKTIIYQTTTLNTRVKIVKSFLICIIFITKIFYLPDVNISSLSPNLNGKTWHPRGYEDRTELQLVASQHGSCLMLFPPCVNTLNTPVHVSKGFMRL